MKKGEKKGARRKKNNIDGFSVYRPYKKLYSSRLSSKKIHAHTFRHESPFHVFKTRRHGVRKLDTLETILSCFSLVHHCCQFQ